MSDMSDNEFVDALIALLAAKSTGTISPQQEKALSDVLETLRITMDQGLEFVRTEDDAE